MIEQSTVIASRASAILIPEMGNLRESVSAWHFSRIVLKLANRSIRLPIGSKFCRSSSIMSSWPFSECHIRGEWTLASSELIQVPDSNATKNSYSKTGNEIARVMFGTDKEVECVEGPRPPCLMRASNFHGGNHVSDPTLPILEPAPPRHNQWQKRLHAGATPIALSSPVVQPRTKPVNDH